MDDVEDKARKALADGIELLGEGYQFMTPEQQARAALVALRLSGLVIERAMKRVGDQEPPDGAICVVRRRTDWLIAQKHQDHGDVLCWRTWEGNSDFLADPDDLYRVLEADQ